MSNTNENTLQKQQLDIHFLGIDIAHSLSTLVHNYICQSLDFPWTFIRTECPTIEDCIRTLRSPKLTGAVITTPWKREIMRHVGKVDETAKLLNACNPAFFNVQGQLCGTNTDSIGIEGALKSVSSHFSLRSGDASSEPVAALVVDAGGAARAAVYPLTAKFGVDELYTLNRDEAEVEQLIRDCRQIEASVVHVKSVYQADQVRVPAYIVGTIPDVEPTTVEEKAVKNILIAALSRGGARRIVLDMCYMIWSKSC